MRYHLQFGPEALHVKMEGVFCYLDSDLFHKILRAIADKHHRSEVHLNVSMLESIDALGLDMLMEAHDMAKKFHRSLIFVEPNGSVMNKLKEAGRYTPLRIAA